MTVLIDKISNHLEFLGYEIDVKEEETLVAKHKSFANLLLHVFSFGTMVKTIYEVSEQGKNHRGDFLERLNLYNSRAQVCRAYFERETDLAIEAVIPNFYDKTAFGVFIDAFNDDVRLIFTGEPNLAAYLS